MGNEHACPHPDQSIPCSGQTSPLSRPWLSSSAQDPRATPTAPSDNPSLHSAQSFPTDHRVDRLNSPRTSAYVDQGHTSSTSVTAPPRTQGPFSHSQHELYHDPAKASDSVEEGLRGPRRRHHLATLDGNSSSDDISILQQNQTDESAALASQEYSFDDLTRTVDVIIPDSYQHTRPFRMMIDSGNPHKSVISSRVVDELRLPRSHKRPSFWKRILHKLTPWTKTARYSKEQARNNLRNMDGRVIEGQDGAVTINWHGRNPFGLQHPVVWFRPVFYKTTHVVVDEKECVADIILSWKDVKRLRLLDRRIAPIRGPPTPDCDKGV